MNHQARHRNLLIALAKRCVELEEQVAEIQARKELAESAVQHAYYKGMRVIANHARRDLLFNLAHNHTAARKFFGTADHHVIAQHEFLDDATAAQVLPS